MTRLPYRVGFSATRHNSKQEMIYFSQDATIDYHGKTIRGKKGDRYFIRTWDGKVKNTYKMDKSDMIVGAKGSYVYIVVKQKELIGHAFDNTVWTGIERKSLYTFSMFLASGNKNNGGIHSAKMYDNEMVIKAQYRGIGEDMAYGAFTNITTEELFAKGWGGYETVQFEYKFIFNSNDNETALIKEWNESIYWNGIKVK